MNQIFSMIINAIKYRFSAITAKLRYWTNANFLRTRFTTKLYEWIIRLFSVKPRHKEDYYSLLGWLVSRRLIHAIIICVGLLCIGYLYTTKPLQSFGKQQEEIEVYAYNSFPLKFKDTTVSITAEKGYIAYTGQVKGGYAEGNGELFREDGGLVYSGTFSKNKYHGTGTQYYPSGQVKYTGEFEDNLYQGNGHLYRENGAIHYIGSFDKDFMHGQGELYNTTGEKIFEGEFKYGEVMYAQLLNKTAEEINNIYTGKQRIYTWNENTIIELEDLAALYVPKKKENSLEEEARSGMVYVIQDVFVFGNKRIDSLSSLKELLGEPQYEGNTYINVYDAVAVKRCMDYGETITIDFELEYSEIYEEYVQVESFNKEALMYMYMYEIDGINYSFLTEGYSDKFVMYTISV